MEITIIKKVFITEEVPDNLSEAELRERVDEIIDEHNDDDDWDDTDWRGKEVYEVYDTDTGITRLELDK